MGTDARPARTEDPLCLRTVDPDVAVDLVTRTYAAHELTLRGRDRLDLRLDLTPPGRLNLARLRYGADVRIFGPPMRRCYHVNLPLSGALRVQQNGTTRTSVAGRSGTALLPTSPLTLWWGADCAQQTITIGTELLESHAAKLAGRPVEGGLRFALEFDVATAPGQAAVATAAFLHTELTRAGGVATMPAARRELESALMTQLLLTIPSQLGEALHAPPPATRRSRILDVVERIDADPAAELSTADLATMAGIGVRALQLGFQEVVGTSPAAYVRGARLDRVRLDLAAGAPGTITEIAARWGLHHPGRFAQQYRDRFGALPSDTARACA